uniref:COesterase domain-containing protein n=1 Tax=Panagrellus redivivus TaxID=6233 RepID=A0A7E4UZB0_PANRE
MVNTSRGPVVGFTLFQNSDQRQLYYGSGNVFLGIPYAEAPTGAHRFKAPIAFKTFPNNPQNATEAPPQCIQYSPVVATSEDCLFLNIYTPINAKNRYLPVIVFIHGGDFTTGPGNIHDPRGIVTNLVSRDVVVVTIQYRLGALGFFTGGDISPNRGILDIIEALKFVQQEIVNFGGNPSRVTLFGEGSGACAVSVLSMAPIAKGLFNQAILQSGSAFRCVNGVYDARNVSQSFIQQVAPSCGLDPNSVMGSDFSEFYKCLMGQDPNSWLNFDKELLLGWQITFDNNLLSMTSATAYSSVLDALKNRTIIPTMYGTCQDEFALKIAQLFKNGLAIKEFDQSYAKSFVKAELPGYSDDLTDLTARILLSPFAPYNMTDTLGWVKAVTSAVSALFYTAPTALEAQLYAQDNRNVYLYEMSYATNVGRSFDFPRWQPVQQTCALPFIFASGSAISNAQYLGRFTTDDWKMVKFFGSIWADFARNGRPSDYWAPVSSTGPLAYLNIGQKQQMMAPYRLDDSILVNDIVKQLLSPVK